MGDWAFFVEIGIVLVTLAVLATLRWAAVERARAHREWAQRQRETQRAPIDWYVVFGITVGCV
jgi:hypothetical protein